MKGNRTFRKKVSMVTAVICTASSLPFAALADEGAGDNFNLDGTLPIVKNADEMDPIEIAIVVPPERTVPTEDLVMVKKMVEKEKKKYGWEFLFFGANIDAIETAGRFGIGADRAFNYECDSVGVSLNYQAISQTLSAVRRSSSKEELDNAVYASCETIRNDYKRRHGKR